jgi:hypothetical protein
MDDFPEALGVGGEPPGEDTSIAGMDERAAWVQLIVTMATTLGYFVVVIPQLLDGGVESVDWVVPMLVAMAVTIVGTILGSILMGVGGAFSAYRRGLDPNVELGSDLRDRDITRFATRRSIGFLYAGLLLALVLSMLDADTLWIGTAVFLMGALGAIAEAIVRVAAYRRGFVE